MKHKEDTGTCQDCRSSLSFAQNSFKFTYRIDWQTPDEYIEAARQVMGEIELDPASSDNAQQRIQAKRYHTGKDNGLIQHWSGKVWINPPYGLLPEMIAKLVNHYASGDITEAILFTHTLEVWADWFQFVTKNCSSFCLLDHLVKWHCGHEADLPKIRMFEGKDPEYDQRGTIAVYFGPNQNKFAEVFGRYGVISHVRNSTNIDQGSTPGD